MDNRYEKNNFIKGFGLTVFIIFGIILSTLLVCKVDYLVTAIVCIAFIIGVGILFAISYKRISSLLDEVKEASDIMIDVVLEKDEISEESFKEGTMGLLYTNMYKMISSLRESKQKELDEKIFLRDIIQDISHQLKTPLASLNVFVDLLLDDTFDDKEKKAKMLEESKNQLTRMEWMVLAMLKLARIEAGAVSFDNTNQNIYSIIVRACDGISYLTDQRNQKVIVNCDENLELSCDGDWLTEAIINIMKNASDYSDKNKNIYVDVEKTDVFVRIYIKDEGVGISEKDMPNIFKRFYRVNHQVNPNSVGIGLSLAKSIVEGMGANITVRSEVGKYTCFQITFVNI